MTRATRLSPRRYRLAARTSTRPPRGVPVTIAFTVPGEPVPQGSKRIGRHGRRPVILDDNDAVLRPWRKRVAQHARAHGLGQPIDSPVRVALVAHLTRPKSVRRPQPSVKPDVDKIARAMLDGLVDGRLLVDDGRVVDLRVSKHYATPQNPPGVAVSVTWWIRVD